MGKQNAILLVGKTKYFPISMSYWDICVLIFFILGHVNWDMITCPGHINGCAYYGCHSFGFKGQTCFEECEGRHMNLDKDAAALNSLQIVIMVAPPRSYCREFPKQMFAFKFKTLHSTNNNLIGSSSKAIRLILNL